MGCKQWARQRNGHRSTMGMGACINCQVSNFQWKINWMWHPKTWAQTKNLMAYVEISCRINANRHPQWIKSTYSFIMCSTKKVMTALPNQWKHCQKGQTQCSECRPFSSVKTRSRKRRDSEVPVSSRYYGRSALSILISAGPPSFSELGHYHQSTYPFCSASSALYLINFCSKPDPFENIYFFSRFRSAEWKRFLKNIHEEHKGDTSRIAELLKLDHTQYPWYCERERAYWLLRQIRREGYICRNWVLRR